MKNMKKIVSVVLAMVMVLAMGITAAAATITISGGAKGSEYAAYKLLDATHNGSDKYSYTVNDKYRDVLKTVTKKTSDSDIISYIADQNTAEKTRAFADSVYRKIKEDSSISADKTTSNDKFEEVEQGYYLIAEIKTGNTHDTYSLVMLDTAGNSDITVDTKESVPTLVKKVKDVNDSTNTTSEWQDSADADVDDEVEYQLTGTVSDKIDDYKTYYYEFHDTMTHLTYVEESCKVMVNGVDCTDQFKVVWDTEEKKLTVTCDDLKKLNGITVNKDTKVVVTYKATLDKDAVVGSTGNPNTAYLEYNNNPYYDGTGKGETGQTPKDTNIVFTYKTIINKVNENKEPLSGADFKLEKFVAKENGSVEYKNAKGEWVEIKNKTNGGTIFTFSGLDDGYYRLTETETPQGYNSIESIYFEIKAEHQIEADNPKLTSLNGIMDKGEITFTSSTTEGSLSTTVVNKPGTELPSTGGMGTTIFYVLGTILVLGAGVVLIARKRMKSER